MAVFAGGARLAVTNSNRFGDGGGPPSLTVIDTGKISGGKEAILGSVPAGAFPRELSVTKNQQILLLTNFGSKTLAVMDIARLPLEPRQK